MAENRLLILDDEPAVAEFLSTAAQTVGYATRQATTIPEFESALAEFAPTVITLDLNLKDGDGIDLLRHLAELRIDASVLVVSGVDPRTLAMLDRLSMMRRLTLVGVLAKPVVHDTLVEHLKRALRPPKVTPVRLEEALTAGRLSIHYQPRVSLRSEDRPILGAEAFLRWMDEGRTIPPAEFLDVARNYGLMPRLTDFVLVHALQQLSAWHRQGLDLSLSVNFDPRLVDDFRFADRLVALLREFDIRPDALTLDLQEVAAIQDPDLTASVLTRLRIYNVQVAFDDFGIGYSSLTQLRALPFSEVKIASELTNGLDVGTDAAAFVDVIIKLCGTLKLRICAEGVESWAAERVLRFSGCDEAQGYLFGPPMPALEFVRWVRTWDGRPGERVEKPVWG